MLASSLTPDPTKFESIYQVGGIRTARFDWPDAGGSPGCRVAMVDTGGGLRFTIALDRGGDIIEASYLNTNLAYLTPIGYRPPSSTISHDDHWLRCWPAGLVCACGPRYIGPGREEDGQSVHLHGPLNNTPVALVNITNPNVRAGRLDIGLDMKVGEARLYGPNIEVQRSVRCRLGEPWVKLRDTVTNLGDTAVPHSWLYHVNFGYPLLDEGAQLVYHGRLTGGWQMGPNLTMGDIDRTAGGYEPWLTVPPPMAEHAGSVSRGLIVDVGADSQGVARVGLINRKANLAVELTYPAEQLPRLANWQHYGPSGMYVSALEPYYGTLFGKANDDHPLATAGLDPGQSRSYEVAIMVHGDDASIGALAAAAGPIEPWGS